MCRSPTCNSQGNTAKLTGLQRGNPNAYKSKKVPAKNAVSVQEDKPWAYCSQKRNKAKELYYWRARTPTYSIDTERSKKYTTQQKSHGTFKPCQPSYIANS